jgi:ABC-type transport system involved in cytochrome c biogenesis ATPase subunit
MNLLEAERLTLSFSGLPLFDGLSFQLRPGLTLLRGGELCGKSTLLRLIAGTQAADAGELRRHARSCFHEQPADPAHDAIVARAWLASRQTALAHWDEELAETLVDAFGLVDHIDKPMYMLSAGSRRKVGLLAAAASGAELTLLDTPFAALDSASCRVLASLLAEAAGSEHRAWVLADYELPPLLAGVQLAGVIDLGDEPPSAR